MFVRLTDRRIHFRTAALLITVSTIALGGCGDKATESMAEGTGPSPTLPTPHKTLIPTLNIAPAKGWAAGVTPVAAPGLAVNAFASGLDHPRWLAVLPNGDVLVAETNAPPKPDDGKGIRGWVQKTDHEAGRFGHAKRQSHHPAPRYQGYGCRRYEDRPSSRG